MTTWYDVADAAGQQRLIAAWPDAPIENTEVCGMVLEVAQEQVIDYAPAATPTEQVVSLLTVLGYDDTVIADVTAIVGGVVTDPPARYVLAQLQQARNLWNSGRTTGEGDVGPDGFVFRPYPLDKTIKQIIRPVDGKPHVL